MNFYLKLVCKDSNPLTVLRDSCNITGHTVQFVDSVGGELFRRCCWRHGILGPWEFMLGEDRKVVTRLCYLMENTYIIPYHLIYSFVHLQQTHYPRPGHCGSKVYRILM